jgi:hypothetical protein
MSQVNEVAPTMTVEQLLAEREKLQAQIQALRDAQVQTKRNTFSVSLSEFVAETDSKGNVKRDAAGNPVMKPGKGGFKVTGLGSRFPITLYPEQWEILFANQEAIKACYNDPSNRAKSDRLRKA